LYRSVAYFIEEAVQGGALEEDLPSGARTLPENHVRDAFALRERDQAVRRFVGPHAYDRRTELLCQREIALKGLAVFGLDMAWRFAWCLDIDRIPARTKARRDAKARALDAGRIRARAHADHHALGNQRRFQPFALAVRRGLLTDLVRDGAERELT
jgi:hypothetical protein